MKVPEFKLALVPVTEEARAVGFRGRVAADLGKRHKIGGDPDYMQRSDVPNCPSCGEAMSFYAQLDSVGDGYWIADCGLVYVFLCFDCFESASFVQSA